MVLVSSSSNNGDVNDDNSMQEDDNHNNDAIYKCEKLFLLYHFDNRKGIEIWTRGFLLPKELLPIAKP